MTTPMGDLKPEAEATNTSNISRLSRLMINKLGKEK